MHRWVESLKRECNFMIIVFNLKTRNSNFVIQYIYEIMLLGMNRLDQLIYQNTSYCISLFFFSKQVSWFRKQNTTLNLLTIGKDSFSADPRYSVAFRKPENWRLKIRPVMAKDNGTYLCQVSTHPPIIFLQHLKVIGM